MSKDINYILIESSLNKALKDIQDDPERTIRNLIDYGLEFAKGSIQKQSLQLAQQLLKDENSHYYQLIRHTASHVDHRTLLGFGLNVGYNGFTMGIKRIRDLEEQEHFHIPWILFLKVEYLKEKPISSFCRFIEQGMELGIYVYVFIVEEYVESLLSVVASYTQCAFVLMCRKACLSGEVLEQIAELHNLMLSLCYEHDIDGLIGEMRECGLLYGIHIRYGKKELQNIENGELLQSLESLKPFSIGLLAKDNVDEVDIEGLDQKLYELRFKQSFPSFILHLNRDIRRIDKAFSKEEQCVAFDDAGYLMLEGKIIHQKDANMFQTPLKVILQHYLAKSTKQNKESD